VNCTKSGNTELRTPQPLAINAAVQQRKWHFHSASTDFNGEFRKGNKNKADGTLEIHTTVDLGQGPETCHGGPRTFHAHT